MADASNLVRAFVSMAVDKNTETPESGDTWLKGLRNEAALAVASGDAEMTSVAFEGGSGTGQRSFKSAELLEVTQAALDELTGEGAENDVVHLDYSRRPVCT